MNKSNTPSFFLTYYNPLSSNSKSFTSAYVEYIKNVELVQYNANLTSNLIANKIDKINEDLTIDIQREFSDQNLILEYIEDSIKDGFRKMNQQLSLMNLEILNTNILLQNIQELLKLSDDEKKRMRNIELGLKFMKSSKGNKELIHDSVAEFNSALDYMPQDWFVLYQLGMCYLYDNQILDLDLAKKYFDKAFKYASVDIDDNLSLGKHISEAFFVKNINNIKDDLSLSKSLASEAILQSAFISYIQGDYENAAKLSSKSFSFAPGNARNYLLASKYSIRSGDQLRALDYLSKCMDIDFTSYLLMTSEYEIVNDPYISKELRKFQKDFIRKQIEYQNYKIKQSKINSLKELYDNFITKSIWEELRNISHKIYLNHLQDYKNIKKKYSTLENKYIFESLKNNYKNYNKHCNNVSDLNNLNASLYVYLKYKIDSTDLDYILEKTYISIGGIYDTDNQLHLKLIEIIKENFKDKHPADYLKYENVINGWYLHIKEKTYWERIEDDHIDNITKEYKLYDKKVKEGEEAEKFNTNIKVFFWFFIIMFFIYLFFSKLSDYLSKY